MSPSVGDYRRGAGPAAVQGKVSLAHKNRTDASGADDAPAIQEATGITVYVVGVICVIPAAGLVAWIVRYALRKKVTRPRDLFCKIFVTRRKEMLIFFREKIKKISYLKTGPLALNVNRT